MVSSLILWAKPGLGYAVLLSLILGFALVSSLVLIGLSAMLVRQRYRPVVSSGEQMLGTTATVQADFDGQGRVWAHGESWLAHCNQPLTQGEPVRITQRDGLVLSVQPLNKRKK